MKTSNIEKEDVLSVAYDIKKNLTDKQVLYVLENYDSAQEEDPSATWDLVVENLIYQITNEE